MDRKAFVSKTIEITDLELDFSNPRFEKQKSNRDALEKMAIEQGVKLVKLAEHIARWGLSPSEKVIVVKSARNGRYTVVEGNRRVAAIKLASEPALVESLGLPLTIRKRLKAIHAKSATKLPLSIDCTVAPTRVSAKHWIDLRHTGENDGVGIIRWSGVATARFRGVSPETLFIEMVRESDYLDDVTREKLSKVSITNLQRLLGTPEARRLLGLDVRKRELVFLNPEREEETLARMAIVISDIANKHIRVSHLDSKDQRVTYAGVVSERSLPTPGKKITPTDLSGYVISKSSQGTTQKKRGVSLERKALIPKALKLNITQPRIARIYNELQKLQIVDYPNSCAVLLRVLWEMSLSEYAKENTVSLKLKTVDKKGKKSQRVMSLKDKTKCIADHLMKRDPTCKKEIRSILNLVNTKNTIFSIDNWHQYIHNEHVNPIANDLKLTWDNIQPFYSRLWA